MAGLLVFVFILLTSKGHNKAVTAVAFTAVAIVFYIPAGYYLELTLFRRRQRKMAAAGASKTRDRR